MRLKCFAVSPPACRAVADFEWPAYKSNSTMADSRQVRNTFECSSMVIRYDRIVLKIRRNAHHQHDGEFCICKHLTNRWINGSRGNRKQYAVDPFGNEQAWRSCFLFLLPIPFVDRSTVPC